MKIIDVKPYTSFFDRLRPKYGQFKSLYMIVIERRGSVNIDALSIIESKFNLNLSAGFHIKNVFNLRIGK